MQPAIDPALREAVRLLLGMLANRDYAGIEKVTRGPRLTVAELERAVREYGAKLALPPSRELDELDMIRVTGADLPRYSVAVDLWTTTGRSDLTLELELEENHVGLYDIRVANLHVL
jgi:hypothetical protein